MPIYPVFFCNQLILHRFSFNKCASLFPFFKKPTFVVLLSAQLILHRFWPSFGPVNVPCSIRFLLSFYSNSLFKYGEGFFCAVKPVAVLYYRKDGGTKQPSSTCSLPNWATNQHKRILPTSWIEVRSFALLLSSFSSIY